MGQHFELVLSQSIILRICYICLPFSEAPSSRINTTCSFPPCAVLSVSRVSARISTDIAGHPPICTIFLIKPSPHRGDTYSLDGKICVARYLDGILRIYPIRFWYMVHLASWKGWSLILLFISLFFLSSSFFLFLPFRKRVLDSGYY